MLLYLNQCAWVTHVSRMNECMCAIRVFPSFFFYLNLYPFKVVTFINVCMTFGVMLENFAREMCIVGMYLYTILDGDIKKHVEVTQEIFLLINLFYILIIAPSLLSPSPILINPPQLLLCFSFREGDAPMGTSPPGISSHSSTKCILSHCSPIKQSS